MSGGERLAKNEELVRKMIVSKQREKSAQKLPSGRTVKQRIARANEGDEKP